MRKHHIFSLLILVVISLLGCERLDDQLFNNDNTITCYLRDDYKGEQDFILDSSYDISDSLIHTFTVSSKTSSESDATSIYATYIGDIVNINRDTVIMYCHGNKWHMDFYWQRAKLLAHVGGKNNYGVMMVDYRGYGLSNGEPTEDGMYADVEAALKWLKINGLTDNRLVIYGFSLGSAPACELTANPRSLKPSKLILEAPYASAAVMAQDASVLAMPSSFVTNLKIDNAEEIKKINQPFMWMHGTKDLYLNIETHGQLIYDNYQGTYQEAHKINNADHSEVPSFYGYLDYRNDIHAFIIR